MHVGAEHHPQGGLDELYVLCQAEFPEGTQAQVAATAVDQDDDIESRYRRALASKLAEGYMLSAAELTALRAETVLPPHVTQNAAAA